MITFLQSKLNRFRILAFFEGVSFLLILFVTMPLKYFYQNPQPNKIVGMVHGLLFVLYILELIQVKIEFKWKTKKTILAAIASVVPFGTFIAEKYLFSKTDSDESI
jgi:integral membrane protein